MKPNAIHHIAIICSDKDKAMEFYHEKLGLPIIRENYRPERDDWKIDLSINSTTELELFIMKDRPERVSNPEAYGLRHLAFKHNHLVNYRYATPIRAIFTRTRIAETRIK